MDFELPLAAAVSDAPTTPIILVAGDGEVGEYCIMSGDLAGDGGAAGSGVADMVPAVPLLFGAAVASAVIVAACPEKIEAAERPPAEVICWRMARDFSCKDMMSWR